MISVVRKMFLAAAAGCLLLGGVQVSQANIVPVLREIIPEGDNYRWVYDVHVDQNHRVEEGDFFTIYDFAGFVDGSNQQPAEWSFSAQATGVTPPTVLPDDGALPNLTWTWTGDPLAAGLGSDFDLGEFSALSEYGGVILGTFTSRSTKDIQEGPGVIEDGEPTDAIGSVAVPIPLPAAVYVFPLGIAVAGLAYRRMRRGV